MQTYLYYFKLGYTGFILEGAGFEGFLSAEKLHDK